MNATKPHLSFYEMFAMSAVAAAVSKSSMAPLERSSLLMSVAEGNTSQRFRFPPWFVWRRVIEEQGIASFWRGNVTNVLRYVPAAALNFAFNDSLQRRVNNDHHLGLVGNVALGSIAGVAALACVFSLDTVRTLVAEDRGNALRHQELKRFHGGFDCYKKVLRSDGVARLYRGFLICSCGVAVYRGLYFGLYLSLQPQLPVNNFVGHYALGWGVAVVAMLASYPMDTVRRRTRFAGVSVWNCARQMARNEGLRTFMRGASTTIPRALVGSGVLAGVDSLSWLIGTTR
jgi:solute carrier family 25 (mitochondrial adenine nucleotide translocator), member 4/5/6/31